MIQFLLSLVQPAAGKRLGKRQLLAIGPGLLADQQQQDRDEQPAKRLRSDSSPSSAVHIIESLEQELQNSGRLSFMTPATTRPSTISDGPIIADVTDDPEHYDVHEPRQESSGTTVPIGSIQQPNIQAMAAGHSYPQIIDADGNSIDEAVLQAPEPGRRVSNLPFGSLAPGGMAKFKGKPLIYYHF